MSGGRSLALVVARELREATRRRSFWVIVILAAVGSTVAVTLPDVLGGDRDSFTIGVVAGSDDLDSVLVHIQEPLAADIVVRPVESATSARQQVEAGGVEVAVVAGAHAEVIARAGQNDRLVGAVQQVLANHAMAERLADAGLSDAEVTGVLDIPAVPVARVDADSESRRASAVIISIALYLLLLILTMQVANGIAIEKANRISEVLLAIVRPGALIFGKVIGVGLVGVLTLLAGALPVLIKFSLGGSLPAGLATAIVAGAPWFALGAALYLILAGSLGALVERQEEAGTAMAPLSMLLIGSCIVGQSFADTPVGAVLALVPLSSPLVMAPRIAVGAASGAEIAVSLAVLLVSVIVVARAGATIYGRAVVRTGRRLTIREALRPA